MYVWFRINRKNVSNHFFWIKLMKWLWNGSHRSESGKFAKRPNEKVRYGPEKTLLNHLRVYPTSLCVPSPRIADSSWVLGKFFIGECFIIEVRLCLVEMFNFVKLPLLTPSRKELCIYKNIELIFLPCLLYFTIDFYFDYLNLQLVSSRYSQTNLLPPQVYPQCCVFLPCTP